MSYPETTLSSPLLEAAYDQFFSEITTPTPKRSTEVHRLVYQLTLDHKDVLPELIVRHSPWMTPSLSLIGTKDNRVTLEMAHGGLDGSADFLAKYMSALRKGFKATSGLDVAGISRINSTDPLSTPVLESYRNAFYWVNLVEACVKSSTTGIWTGIMNALCCRRFALVQHDGKWVLLTYDVVLMMKDMMYSRFLIESLGSIDPERTHLHRNLTRFTDWGNEVLLTYGNNGYDLIKSIEALTKVRLIQLTEKWLDADSQANEMVQKYVTREKAMNGFGTCVSRLWNFIASINSTLQIGEIFGFLKLLGHPYVDPRSGCRKVQDLLNTPDYKNPAACSALGWSFCHIYTRGYLSSKGEWPRMIFRPTPSGPCKLERLMKRNQPSLAFGFTQYDASDWEYATFLPHQNFSIGEDILELMSDRAISYPRDEFDAVWYGKLDYAPPKPTRSKRALEELLTMESLDMSEVVDIVKSGNIPEAWKIVAVSPKEREMKRDPRMFAKMVLEMRSFFVLAEKNLKDGVFKFVKEQTMTLNRQELLSRFLDVTKEGGTRLVKLFVEIDFSSWNLHFDALNMDPIGVRLNEIYGQPGVYTAVHRFFQDCLIVMDNADYPPDGLDASTRESVLNGTMYLDTVWGGHDRGFEGIAQGPWTLATVALGHMAVQHLGIPFVMNGQGDNQVYCFEVYVPDDITESQTRSYIRQLENTVLRRLETTAHSVGHEIKPEECMCSTAFFSYGKEMFAGGSYLPCLPKFISRMFPTTSSDSPSIYEYISTVSSGGTASTEKSNVSLPCLALTKFIESITVRREFKRSILHGPHLKDEMERLSGKNQLVEDVYLNLLCTIPSNLGGLPISSPLEFLYRGHSDPLASSMAGLDLLQELPGVKQYQRCLRRGIFRKRNPDITGLIMDPYSIPLDRASPSSSSVTSHVTPVLLDKIKNRDLADLKIVASEEHRQALMEWMGSIKPVYPKILHELYKGSPFGVLDGLAARFTNTRTLKSLAKGTGEDLAGLSVRADLRYMKDVVSRISWVFKIGYDDLDQRCESFAPYGQLCVMRRDWGLGELEGVTNIHPINCGRILRMPEEASDLHGDCEVIVMCQSGNSTTCGTTRGPLIPFLGTKTDDKSVGKWVRPVDSSPPLRDLLRILTIQGNMALPNSAIWDSFDTLAQTRTSLDLDPLRQFIKVRIGGTDAHRRHTRDDERGSFCNMSTNWPTNLVVSTNNAGSLGAIDYPFDFQEAITALQGLLTWVLFDTPTEAPFGLVLQVDLTKISPIADHILSSERELKLPPGMGNSYYLTVDHVTVSSRALTAAQFVSHDIMSFVPTVEVPINMALTSHLLSHLTGKIAITSKFGHTLGKISHKRIIDLPDLNKVSFRTFISCLASAVRLKIAFAASIISNVKTRPIHDVLTSMVRTEARRSIPSLYGTLRELAADEDSRHYLVGLGEPSLERALPRIMAQVIDQAVAANHRIQVCLFLRGSSSVSRSLYTYLGQEVSRLLINADTETFPKVKMITYVMTEINKEDSEVNKARQLLSLIVSLGGMGGVVKSQISPEEILRRLRTTELPPADCTKTCTYRSIVQRSAHPLCTPGENSLLRYSIPRLDNQDLVESWLHRDDSLRAGAVGWSPLRGAVGSGISQVLLIGTGDGRMGAALDPNWCVTGVELGSVLAKQGQAMVDFRPPYLSNTFTLHPCSWALGGDILNPHVKSLLITETTLGAYDLVIIDVDRVLPIDRLTIRSEFAAAGAQAYCRVLINDGDVGQFLESYYAYRSQEDWIWTSEIYPYREFYLGGSEEPVGMYPAVNAVDRVRQSVPCVMCSDVTVSYRDPVSISEHVFTLTGDVTGPETLPLTISRCAAIKSYLPLYIESTLQVVYALIQHGCPRRRIRSLVILDKMNLIQAS